MNNRFFESYYTVIKQNAENSLYFKKKSIQQKNLLKQELY